MTPWFEDMPLDFNRSETRAAERLVVTGYGTNFALISLAENIGLDTAQLNQMAPVTFLTRDILKKARQADRLLTLIAEILADDGQKASHDGLRELISGHTDEVRDAGMNRRPSIALLAALPPDMSTWGADDAEPVPAAEQGFERIVNAMAGFVDPAKFRLSIAEAEVRTARVEVAGKPRGTGFLIGSDLLITNWHVVERGVDGALARFDHSGNDDGRAVKFADDWQVAHSPHDSEANELSPDGPAEGTWDFAVVRLAEPVGDQAIGPDLANAVAERRGFYQLNWEPYDFESGEPLFILGHPIGGPIQLSNASPAGARFTKLRNRVRYDTNTDSGSSGSPVFNRDFRVVALHNSGSKGAGPGMFNQGVPISGIGAALRGELAGKPQLTMLGLA